MTQDLNNGIENIEYNVLNLPKLITFANGNTIRYTYSATGDKLRTEYSMTSDSIIKTTDYCGNLIYEQGRPHMLLVDGGYVTFNDNANGNVCDSMQWHYYLTDHLGNNRVVVNTNDSIEQVNHYYPYGGLMAESTGGDTQRYKYNGKELDRMHGLDWYDYGARWMNGLTFTTQDRFAEKYYETSPYMYCQGNPMKYMDVNGDSLWISHRGNDYLYQNGTLYNKDGSVYDGKIKGFLSKSVNALKEIGKTQEGSNLINELQSSSNNFKIAKGDNRFVANNVTKAYANQILTDPSQHQILQVDGVNLYGGSGGTIFWNPSGTILSTTSGSKKNSTTDLAHELFHGLDANRGLLDDRDEQGVKRSEWQATYRENVLRSQLGMPLRTHYINLLDTNGKYIGGYGPYLLTPLNTPLLPAWYKH